MNYCEGSCCPEPEPEPENKYTLTLSSGVDGLSNTSGHSCNEDEMVKLYGAGEYNEGDTAIASTEWNNACVIHGNNKPQFTGWYQGNSLVSTNKKYSVKMNSDKSLKAKWGFGPVQTGCTSSTTATVRIQPQGSHSETNWYLSAHATLDKSVEQAVTISGTIYHDAGQCSYSITVPSGSTSSGSGKDIGCDLDGGNYQNVHGTGSASPRGCVSSVKVVY